MGPHPTHRTRFSFDASTYDEICELCGANDVGKVMEITEAQLDRFLQEVNSTLNVCGEDSPE